jgi:Ring finger domain
VSNEKKNRKKRKKLLNAADHDGIDEIPIDAVEIPDVSMVGMDDSLDRNSRSPTDSYGDVESASAVTVSPGTTASSLNSSQQTSLASSRHRANTRDSSDKVYSSRNYEVHSDSGSEDHTDQLSCNVPTLGDESSSKGLKKVESLDTEDESSTIDYLAHSTLRVPVPITRHESFTTVSSEYTYDDGSTTGDNVCPICLSGYEKGEILVISKHCTHCFHKDCILEWLEKHDDCPICRVNMVTDSELSRAATLLIGKMRMYRAVASLQTSSLQSNQGYQTHPRSHTAANISQGTIRFSQGLHFGMV